MNKIIFGITSLTLGGAERVLIDVANKLSKIYDVTIFTIYSEGELEKELNKEIKLKSLYNKTYNDLTRIEKRIIPIKIFFNNKKIYKKFIDDEDYIAQIAFLEGAITRIFSAKSSKKIKKIAWIHNDISKVFGYNIKSKIKRILDRNVYEKYDSLVFVSIDNLDKFNKVYDDILLPHETVINNYIDKERIIKLSEDTTQETPFKEDEINFLQVSRLVEQKAIDRLIDAHTKLIKQGVKHHIYIIGDGPLKTKLEKKIKQNNIENTFTLLGAKKNPYPYIKKSDFFCLFSYFEGYPMVVEEAKILRKYILATNTSTREVLINYPENSQIAPNSEEGIINIIETAVKNNKKLLNKSNDYIYANDKIIDKIIKTVNKENVNK